MLNDFILWMGSLFSREQYIVWTQLQSFAWTAADLFIVFYLLRCANLGRRLLGRRPHVFSFVVLGMTALLAPLLLVAPDGEIILRLELLITVPHFCLILYVLVSDWRTFPAALARLVSGKERQPG